MASQTAASASSSSANNALPSTATLNSEEIKYLEKFKDMQQQVESMEKANDQLTLKLSRAKGAISRLKIERRILYEKLQSVVGDSSVIAGEDHSDSEESVAGGQADEDASAMSDTEHLASQPSKPKKRKITKDPNAPKKPANSFFLFCQIERESMKDKEDTKDLSRSEVTKVLSERWKAMSKEEKHKYYELYEQERARYETAMAEYSQEKRASELDTVAVATASQNMAGSEEDEDIDVDAQEF